MTTPVFRKRNLDRDLAKEGVWLDMYDSDGSHWGRYKCRLLGDANLTYRAARMRIMRRLTRAQRISLEGDKPNQDLSNRIDIECFVETILVDWEPPTEDGSKPELNLDNALALFIPELWLFEGIEAEAQKEIHFRSKAQDDTAKN